MSAAVLNSSPLNNLPNSTRSDNGFSATLPEYMALDYVPSMPDTDSDILKYAGITINDNDYGWCGQDVGGRNILVLVPQVEGGTTYVVLQHMSFD